MMIMFEIPKPTKEQKKIIEEVSKRYKEIKKLKQYNPTFIEAFS